MKIKGLIIPLKILLVFLAVTIFLSNANATVTISNVSPPDGAIHVDIENNPPNRQEYVNLSFQLNDSTGGGDMEFYLDILSPKWSGNGGGYWSYYREIWIDNTGGSEINNSYINITLSSTNFDFSHAQPDGDDIRFIDNASDILSGDDLTQNTVRLWYNSSNQSAKFSVKIPNIPANTNYRIWIAYGNDRASWTGLSEFSIYDDFSTDTTSEYERFDPDRWDYYFRYRYGAKTTANWTMEITDINALNWGGGIYIGMSGEKGTTITNRTYFAIRYNTDIGATETTAVVRFYCQNSSGSTDSGSWDLVLTEGNTYEFKIIVNRLKTEIPNLTLATDIIVGFPGETEADFEKLLAFIQAARLDRVGAFAYSPVKGAAANTLPGMVPAEIKKERLARLMETLKAISANKLQERINQTVMVLVDEVTP